MSSYDRSVRFSNEEGTECVPLNSRTDIDCNASTIAMETSTFLISTVGNDDTTDPNVALLTESDETNTKVYVASHMSKYEVMKNTYVLSISFSLLFGSFNSQLTLQSSINRTDGIGTFSLVVVYVGMMFSSMFLSAIITDRIGLKLTICFSMIMFVIYMAVNLYPVWGIMVPAALLCGMASGLLWTSQSSYLSQIGISYSKTTNTKHKDSLSYLFGIFYMCVNVGKLSGNFLVALLLKQDRKESKPMTIKEIQGCVANKRDAVDNANTLERPDNTTIYYICSTWIGVAVLGIIVLAFLNPIDKDRDMSKYEKKTPICDKFLSIVKHLWNSRLQKLMIPISFHFGLSTGFLLADFTKSVVGCTFGVHAVSDVMVFHGICYIVSAALAGCLTKNIGQLPCLSISFLCYGGVQSCLIAWKPGPGYGYLLFIVAGVWGVADAIAKTQVLSIYGHLFADNTEAAFGNYFVFDAFGYITSFFYSTILSTDIKLYILLSLLLCSATSYYTAEYIDRKDRA